MCSSTGECAAASEMSSDFRKVLLPRPAEPKTTSGSELRSMVSTRCWAR